MRSCKLRTIRGADYSPTYMVLHEIEGTRGGCEAVRSRQDEDVLFAVCPANLLLIAVHATYDIVHAQQLFEHKT